MTNNDYIKNLKKKLTAEKLRKEIQNVYALKENKNEKEINAQLKTIGLPCEKDLPENTTTFKKEKTKNYSNSSKDGKWVTINGNHVLIEK